MDIKFLISKTFETSQARLCSTGTKLGERTSSWTSDWRLEMSGPWQKAARTSTNQNTWTGRMPLSTRELYSIYGELQRLILCCLQLILQGLTPVKCEDGNLWRCVKNLHKVSEGSHNLTRWVFPKIVGFPPKSCILIGFSIINYKPSILGPLESTPPSKFPPVPIEFVFHGLPPLELQ